MFETILIATDLTPQSKVALDLAAALAASHGATLVAVHVVEMPLELRRWSAPLFRTELAAYRQLLDRQLESARLAMDRELGPARRRLGAREIVRIVRAGVSAEVVASVADEVKADLIVVARGRGGRLGATAEQVVRLVGRTVLVAPVTATARLRAAGRPPAIEGENVRRLPAASRARRQRSEDDR